MKKRTLIITLIVLAVYFLIYLSFHIPLGTFEYQDKEKKLKIKLSGTYEGWSFGNAVNTIRYRINYKDKEFGSSYDTERFLLSIIILNRKGEEIILLHDEGQFEDYAKCENGTCKEFGFEFPINSWRFYGDTLILDTGEKIFGDTVTEIHFNGESFIKRK